MNEDKIIDTLQSFSEMHKFDYDCDSLPYIPFGGMRGDVQNSIFYMYVRRTESSLDGTYDTVFGISNDDIIPKGFCIENIGGPNRKGKPFKDQISILSYDEDFVNKTLNKRVKSEIVKYLDELDKLDSSFFETRSTLRISEDGISLTVDKLFQEVDELNTAYSAIIKFLKRLETYFTEISNKATGADGV